MPDLRAICARLAGNELVAEECANLTGGRPDGEGAAKCMQIDAIPRSAFISLGVRCLAEAGSLPELAAQAAVLPVEADRFRVDLLRLAEHSLLRKSQAVLAIANALPARPDLDHPRRRFLVVEQTEKLWLAEILVENQRTYEQHDAKPYHTSSSLPARLARALVNLVAPPAQTLIDPLCGAGSILLEANAIGLKALGFDWNPKMVGMARRNLRHFGYPPAVDLCDARQLTAQADALVTDLPYGRLLESDHSGLPDLLAQTARLAPLAIYLAEEDISLQLSAVGYRQVECWRVRKRFGMARFVHRARV